MKLVIVTVTLSFDDDGCCRAGSRGLILMPLLAALSSGARPPRLLTVHVCCWPGVLIRLCRWLFYSPQGLRRAAFEGGCCGEADDQGRHQRQAGVSAAPAVGWLAGGAGAAARARKRGSRCYRMADSSPSG
jgi:hypothetical protein